MSILIKGIDMPKEGEHIVTLIKSNGKCTYWKQDTEYGICEPMQTVEAIQIPTPHGRLIDADEFTDVCEILADKGGDIRPWEQAEWIAKDMPTILEAER